MSAAKASSARERGRTKASPRPRSAPGTSTKPDAKTRTNRFRAELPRSATEIDFGVHHSSVESEYPRRPESEGDRDRDRQQPERKQLLANCGAQSLLAQPDQQDGAHGNRGQDDELDAREGREECERDEQEL